MTSSVWFLLACSTVLSGSRAITSGFVQRTGLPGCAAEHVVEGVLCRLRLHLGGEAGDLAAQVIDVYAIKGGEALLHTGQLRLQPLHRGVVGRFVLSVQPHDGLYLFLGHALDGSQILSSHLFLLWGPTAVSDTLPCVMPLHLSDTGCAVYSACYRTTLRRVKTL